VGFGVGELVVFDVFGVGLLGFALFFVVGVDVCVCEDLVELCFEVGVWMVLVECCECFGEGLL